FFFFSSRRRHTISKRDWSSDVCSSVLIFNYFKLFTTTQIIFHHFIIQYRLLINFFLKELSDFIFNFHNLFLFLIFFLLHYTLYFTIIFSRLFLPTLIDKRNSLDHKIKLKD